jgi:hypothetical protein
MWKSIVLALLTWSTIASFQVYSPDEAKELVPGEITYTIANFGHIPYGKTLMGILRISEPGNLCSPN